MKHNQLCGYDLDWDSQSLYTPAVLENGGPNLETESKISTKISGSVVEFHDNWACAFLCNLPTTILIGPFQSTAWNAAPCTAPHHATHHQKCCLCVHAVHACSFNSQSDIVILNCDLLTNKYLKVTFLCKRMNIWLIIFHSSNSYCRPTIKIETGLRILISAFNW